MNRLMDSKRNEAESGTVMLPMLERRPTQLTYKHHGFRTKLSRFNNETKASFHDLRLPFGSDRHTT
jgi:hypothetical protein